MCVYRPVSIYKWILLCSWNWNSTKIEVCQNVTFYHWASSSWCFKGLSSLQNVRNFSPNSTLSHPEDVTFQQHCCGREPQISWSSINVTHIHSKVFFLSHALYAMAVNKDSKNLKRNGVCNAGQCWVDTSILSPKQGGNSHSIACLLRGKWWNTNIFLRECWDFIVPFGLGKQLSFKMAFSDLMHDCEVTYRLELDGVWGWLISQAVAWSVHQEGVLIHYWSNQKYGVSKLRFPHMEEFLWKLQAVWAPMIKKVHQPCPRPKKV